jgi:hypothetical protein
MMNIRGLVMEDQDSTSYPSRPLKFASNPGTNGTLRGIALQTLQPEALPNPAIDVTDEADTGHKE